MHEGCYRKECFMPTLFSFSTQVKFSTPLQCSQRASKRKKQRKASEYDSFQSFPVKMQEEA